MKKTILLLILFMPLLIYAQNTTLHYKKNDTISRGIKWVERLSWEEIKEKAKKNNKYIFVDCYATWCGPCKKMDKEVYTTDTVGDLFNDRFLSVRVQMDKTKNDDDWIKNWYKDAQSLSEKYKVQGYPTLLFFSPDGKIVEKHLGYQSVDELIPAALTALKPGKIYDDPYAEYDRALAEYRSGNLDYDKMPYLIKTAIRIHDLKIGAEIGKDYLNYLMGLKEEKLYKKENIVFITENFAISSKSKVFRLFYPDGSKVNAVMQRKGYAETIVDKTIQAEIVDSFYKTQPGGAAISSGMILGLNPLYLTEDLEKCNYPEANWNKLYKTIKKRYGYTYAKRNVSEARLRWYEAQRNYKSFTALYLRQLKKNPPDLPDSSERFKLNRNCFELVFMNITDKKNLLKTSKWMKKSLDMASKAQKDNPNDIDTYANLLYKAGKKEKAIKWETIASAFAKSSRADTSLFLLADTSFYDAILEQMKKGAPTNIDRFPKGAKWDGIEWANWEDVQFPKGIFIQDAAGKPLFGASVTLTRTNESKATEKKANGWVVFNEVMVGDVFAISKDGYAPEKLSVGTTRVAITVTLRKM